MHALRSRSMALLGLTILCLGQLVVAPAAFGADEQTYIVLYKQQATPADAKATVQRAGGTLVAAYGQIGVDFIEAHHLTPLSELSGDAVHLDPRRDFSVLCSNCHRMIHHGKCWLTVEELRTVLAAGRTQ